VVIGCGVSGQSLSAYGNGLAFDYPFIETEKPSTLAVYGNGLIRKTAVASPDSEHSEPGGTGFDSEIMRGVVYHDSYCRSQI
jgi:hypothetical protein